MLPLNMLHVSHSVINQNTFVQTGHCLVHTRKSLKTCTRVLATSESSPITCMIWIMRAVDMLAGRPGTTKASRLTDISFCPDKERIPCHHICTTWFSSSLLQDISDTQRLQESSVIENPPNTCFYLKKGEKKEESCNGVVRCLQCTTNIDGNIRALGSMDKHQVMEVVTRQEQRLANHPLIRFCERRDTIRIPRPEYIRERTVNSSEVSNQLGLMPCRSADW